VLDLVPTTLSAARRFVGRHHRHNIPPQGGLFAVGVATSGELCGVAIIGRPVARKLDDGQTCEITRVATTGERNACSILYGAAARAARALGYRKILTYTLETEPGTSLMAAGWKRVAETPARATWSVPSRPREQVDLFGNDRRPTCGKVRWERQF
jgi:hypothetical protein